MMQYIATTVVLVIAAQLFGVRIHVTYDPSKATIVTEAIQQLGEKLK